MRLPKYDEIARDEEQLTVIETPFDQSLFVAGPPGSGKTVLAVRRAQMLANAGHSVVLVTYNRMLRRLIEQVTGEEEKVYAQTMHSFVYHYYRNQTNGRRVPSLEDYKYDWNRMFTALKRCDVQPSLTHVIVDEGQDLPKDFFRYLRNFVATTIIVFADEEQALSGERSMLHDIKEAAGLDDPVLLKYNHRNRPEIARVAEHFHAGSVPIPVVKREKLGELPEVRLYRKDVVVSLIANWYRNRSGRIGVAVVQNNIGEILCSQLRAQLLGESIHLYTNKKKNENEIDLLGKGIIILNVQSIKGQEFDTVFVMEFDQLLLEVSEVNQRKMYMLCARARDHLFLMYEGDHVPPELLQQLPDDGILKRP